MKTLGLLGGMSWESTSEYYRIINQTVREKLGSPHSGRCVIFSVDFAEISHLQHREEWDKLAIELGKIGTTLEKAGAELILICSNTMHIIAEEIQKNLSVPLLHIADATGKSIKSRGLKKVGLLGTKFTMEKGFYSCHLKENYGIDTIVPEVEDRQVLHKIIYEELISGEFLENSKNQYLKIISRLKNKGAEGIILGCTEIPLLVKPEDTDLPLFDTTRLHVLRAVELALGEK